MKTGFYYFLAAILFFIWFVGYMGYNKTGFFHLTFLSAVVIIIFALLKKYLKNNNETNK